ncbi:MAG: gliding motility protein GldM [Bacteroidales bacterium]|jgi:gliding motility-associated protein GldM|nr:gliding motility protein GldM [Bacteroidales bacterium]
MSGAKETPRQKMIGMMYLVLTAMLALNVSVEILKSFIIVNDAIEESNANFEQKVNATYAQFEKAYLNNPDKIGEAWEKARYVRHISDSVSKIVSDLKIGLIAFCENEPIDTINAQFARGLDIESIIGRQDNYDGPTLYFMGQSETGASGRAHDLFNTLNWYRNRLNEQLGNDTSKVRVDLGIDGKFYDAGGNSKRWEAQYFQHTIIVACLTILNKIQTSLLNSEHDVVAQLFAGTSDEGINFDNVEARILPKSTYVLQGSNYEAEIFVAGYDSKSKISVNIDGHTQTGDSGVVSIKRPATTVGEQIIRGTIRIPTNFGSKDYTFESSYTVAAPIATVSAEKMNVFYIGVDNDVSALGGGLTDANTVVKISNGTISKTSAGRYNVRVTTPGKTTVSVYRDSKEGTQLIGSKEFRVKRVPDPVAKINGQKEGIRNLDKNIFVGAGGLIANLKDFDFDLNVRISSFKLQISRSGELTANMNSNGNRFTPDMEAQIRRCKKGDKVFITEITAQMPDGKRDLGDMVISIL